MLALIDANSFYCSAEQVFRPEWRGKPIVVLSNNDGAVVAANKQAMALGIEKFKPYFQLKAICDRHGIQVCSSNYELYGDLSEKMMSVIARFGPEQFVYSIDEVFLSFKNVTIKDYQHHGHLIRRSVWRETRLPVCVGFGPTMVLAKAANHAAKRLPDFSCAGVCVIDNETSRLKVLAQMKVTDVWGIGSRIGRRLTEMGIETAAQLASFPAKLARQRFSVEVERIILELNGIKAKQWDGNVATKKQIFSTRSLGQRVTDINSLNQALLNHVAMAAQKAREQSSACRVMMMFASSSPFEDKPVGFKHVIHFDVPTNDTLVMSKAVSNALPCLFKEGGRYYKVGIGLFELSSTANRQLDLFVNGEGLGNEPLMKVFDGLNNRFGLKTMFVAGQGIEQKWSMRRSLLTPQYTTNWRHLPVVSCR
ncbi:DNA polymerase V subunit UmuC [Shewanella colwelliana]|uniref:DNA polymerase V subunit UmuC n=1 Tax=Shewanella colwelliana TaxID=23 RepID=A0ABQ4P0A9_SHECO|nr:Y-family DNA polymerase [Shewanella colwelliana]GIU40911.1 DNA polymerase V subunit UmuC [Shewanella colwelliana]